jgi:hypothetical protein
LSLNSLMSWSINLILDGNSTCCEKLLILKKYWSIHDWKKTIIKFIYKQVKTLILKKYWSIHDWKKTIIKFIYKQVKTLILKKYWSIHDWKKSIKFVYKQFKTFNSQKVLVHPWLKNNNNKVYIQIA